LEIREKDGNQQIKEKSCNYETSLETKKRKQRKEAKMQSKE